MSTSLVFRQPWLVQSRIDCRQGRESPFHIQQGSMSAFASERVEQSSIYMMCEKCEAVTASGRLLCRRRLKQRKVRASLGVTERAALNEKVPRKAALFEKESSGLRCRRRTLSTVGCRRWSRSRRACVFELVARAKLAAYVEADCGNRHTDREPPNNLEGFGLLFVVEEDQIAGFCRHKLNWSPVSNDSPTPVGRIPRSIGEGTTLV